MEKENQRVKLTKRIFKESLITLLKKKSIYDIKVKELCEHAELNRTTFYKYYENIHDVLADIEYDILKTGEACINEIEDISKQEIKGILYRQLCNIQQNKDVYYLLLVNSKDKDFYEKLMKTTMDLFKEKTKQSNTDFGENYEYIFSFIVSGVMDIIKRWLCEGMQKSTEQITDLICDLSNKILGLTEK